MFEKIKEIYDKLINLINRTFQGKDIHRLEAFNFEKLSQIMREKGTLQEFEKELKNFEQIERLMQNKTNLHGINHVCRVLFNAYALVTLENVSDEDKKIIIEATKLHDIGRISDGEDTKHGQEGAIKAEKVLEKEGYTREEIEQICFLIKEHSLSREKNIEDINNLPIELREKYEYTLNILKDADKLDRCRIGDLDTKRLTTDSAKRLVEISKDNFEQNRYYYKKKIDLYPYNEENAKQILKEIKEKNENLEITIDDIKKDYTTYKLMQDENKIEWLQAYKKRLKENIPFKDFIEIISKVSIEDMNYLQERFDVYKSVIIEAIHEMGLGKFTQLKESDELHLLMHVKNFKTLDLTDEQKENLLEIPRVMGSISKNYFYLYYSFIKNNEKDASDMLVQAEKDQHKYTNSIRGSDKGYKLSDTRARLSPYMQMIVIKNVDRKLVLDIKEKTKVPLNIILLGLVDLDLLDNDIKIKDIERNEIEKLLINYDRLYLNISDVKDSELLKNLLLDLPDNLTEEEMELIRRCTIGNLKRFKLDSFEKVKDYQKICDEKIIQEFENTDNVEELRKLILETKVNNLKNLRRDLYYYKKYLGEEAGEIHIVNLFNELLKTDDKETLLKVYNELNNSHEKFELDETLVNIRQELKDISKQDVVNQMREMQEKINQMETVQRNGTDVIDLTGKDFNLLISVIGSMGSPYITHWYNKQVHTLNRFYNYNIIHNILCRKFDFDNKYTVKRMINKRFKFDPMKNKQRCLSSIDQDFIGHIPSHEIEEKKQPDEKLILAYFPKSEDDVYLMGNHDLMTIWDKDRSDPTRKRVVHKDNLDDICNLKLKDLNNVTMGNDNEIVVDSYPGAVVCFDKVSDVAKRTAKKHSVPLLYINTKEQFKIMQSKVYEYYDRLRDNLSKVDSVNDEMFEEAFNDIAKENNIVHRALKMVNGFAYLDEKEFPKEETIEIVDKMKDLLKQYISKSNDTQKDKIQNILDEETDKHTSRYNRRFENFICVEQFEDFVAKAQEEQCNVERQ